MYGVQISLFLTVVAVISLTTSLELNDKCSKHDDCTPTGSHCAKNSDCDYGYCSCITGQYYSDGDKCIKVTKVLSKGDSCPKDAADRNKEPCGNNLQCTVCTRDDTIYKCRSPAASLGLASSVLVLIPIIFKVLY